MDIEIQETIAHLTRTVDDLSDIVARQEQEIAELKRHVTLLLERAAAEEQALSGGVTIPGERPPHY
ncbi:MAG: SlyX family protein [Pseudomonadota bacterium]